MKAPRREVDGRREKEGRDRQSNKEIGWKVKNKGSRYGKERGRRASKRLMHSKRNDNTELVISQWSYNKKDKEREIGDVKERRK